MARPPQTTRAGYHPVPAPPAADGCFTCGWNFMNPFEVLHISPDASSEDIKVAYHRLAKQWHPDRFQGAEKADAEQRFRDLALAFAALKDPAQRQDLRRPPGPSAEASEGRSSEGWARLARAALDKDRLDQARACLHQAIRLGGPQHRHHALLAAVLEREGADRRRIIKALEAAVEQNPGDLESHLRLAEHFQGLGMATRAQRHRLQVWRQDPGHPGLRPRRRGWGALLDAGRAGWERFEAWIRGTLGWHRWGREDRP